MGLQIILDTPSALLSRAMFLEESTVVRYGLSVIFVQLRPHSTMGQEILRGIKSTANDVG